jgi:Domain of unknown function (DUF4386)
MTNQNIAITLPARAGTATFFVGSAFLSFAPIAILGPAIGWPASLRSPSAQQLTAIAAAPDAVAAGYGVYLLYSILVLPLMVLVAHRVFGSLARPAAQIVVGLAAVSVLARSIGILRWLTAMPALATQHAAADPGQQKVIETVFSALTTYGGGIGELLGVSLFMGLALATAMVAALVNKSLPRWLAALGLVSAALLLGLFLPTLGLSIQVPIAAAATVLSIWMMVFGVYAAIKPAA